MMAGEVSACFYLEKLLEEVFLIIGESIQLRNMQVMTGNKNVSIVGDGNGNWNHQSPQTCVSSICHNAEFDIQDFQQQTPNSTQRPEGHTHIQIWISPS